MPYLEQANIIQDYFKNLVRNAVSATDDENFIRVQSKFENSNFHKIYCAKDVWGYVFSVYEEAEERIIFETKDLGEIYDYMRGLQLIPSSLVYIEDKQVV